MASNRNGIVAALLVVSGVYCSAWMPNPTKTATSYRHAPVPQTGVCSSLRDSDVDTQVDNDEWIQKNLEDGNKELWESLKGMDGPVVGPEHVLIYDTSLRDGTQGESVSASCDDKLKITRRLVQFGVDLVEAGWPGSNPKDAEFFQRAKSELTEDERQCLAAFGSTRRKGITPQEDAQIQALLESQAPTLCIVAKANLYQVTDILRATPQENLDMIYESVHYLVQNKRKVYVDLEHFFDGYFAQDDEYTLQCCRAAVNAGASGLVLCDTNGGTMPWQIQTATEGIVKEFGSKVTIGIHVHNDCGLAVANSLTAIRAGVGLVQGTMNGIGERTGNADLCSIVPTLALHMESKTSCNSNLDQITSLSRFVDEILNRTPNQAAPYVGASAFAHKGGLHVAAMERSPMSYQHVEPSQVGNEKRVLISELSGRQNILGKVKEAGYVGEEASHHALAILNRVKELEAKGYTFEGAEASVQIMILHASQGYCPPFKVLDYSAQVFDTNLDPALRTLRSADCKDNNGATSRATIKVRTPNFDDKLEVSDGNGPVDALVSALKKALVPSHPSLEGVELVDYKVRILDPESATAAATRVMVEFRDKESDDHWTTVSVDRNVISASLNAVVDGFEYALIEHAQSCMLCDEDGDEEYPN